MNAPADPAVQRATAALLPPPIALFANGLAAPPIGVACGLKAVWPIASESIC